MPTKKTKKETKKQTKDKVEDIVIKDTDNIEIEVVEPKKIIIPELSKEGQDFQIKLLELKFKVIKETFNLYKTDRQMKKMLKNKIKEILDF